MANIEWEGPRYTVLEGKGRNGTRYRVEWVVAGGYLAYKDDAVVFKMFPSAQDAMEALEKLEQ